MHFWDNTYDFVRYFDVKNVRKIEKELDTIRIGLLKLHVNIPQYRKNEEVGERW